MLKPTRFLQPAMKAYLITTGTVFGLLALAHLWRVVEESAQLARDPWFVVITVVAAAISFWAFSLLRKTRAG
jgi:dolichyl-phosphate-mannose--protein O-mannosyl transferase